ncbi:MAG: protease inhibitor I42 family protein [Methanocorpusculum sp.]|nr:protease inhibitor I42 family protein [Methanocorpusculum sp.]MBR5008166.1 protease inhibitor I42 family protein [Methanocorpusculum sp.]MBR5142155.1 protease inhibitor I42 family protein [Methanocorpusculum sp.]
MKKIIILSLASIVLFGCVFGAGCISNDNIEFSYSGGEQSISAKAGEIITITTETNPSTGYSWTEPVVSEGLTIVGTGSYSDAEPGLVGAGGFCYWNVTAEKAGTYTFTTEYKRPWEDKVSSTITVTLTFY